MAALVLNLILATWLFVSAFVLPQTPATTWNALIVSVLVAVIAFLAYSAPGKPGLRYINTVLAFWLLFSVFVLPRLSGGSLVSDLLVSMGLAVVSLVPPFHRKHAGPEQRPAHAHG